MTLSFIMAQIIGIISFVISLIAYHRKKKQKIFQTMMIANVLDILHYLFLGAYSGCVTKAIALVRNEIIIAKEKNKKIDNNIVLAILFIIYLLAGIITYKNIYSILPILAAMIYLYFVWNGNELKVKKVAFYCYFLWLTYNIFVFSIAGIVSNVVSIISTFIAMKNQKKRLK
jgi:cell shape-determining protein MreD